VSSKGRLFLATTTSTLFYQNSIQKISFNILKFIILSKENIGSMVEKQGYELLFYSHNCNDYTGNYLLKTPIKQLTIC